MSRPPHSRTKPPAPKERPVSLAVGGGAFAPPTFPSSPETSGGGKGDMVGFWAFTALIALGLFAAARALLVM